VWEMSKSPPTEFVAIAITKPHVIQSTVQLDRTLSISFVYYTAATLTCKQFVIGGDLPVVKTWSPRQQFFGNAPTLPSTTFRNNRYRQLPVTKMCIPSSNHYRLF
jgi:hypothetical protein